MSAILNAAAATAAVRAPHAPSVRQRPGILLTRGRSRCAAVKAQVVSNGGGGWTLKSSSSPSTAVGASATSPGLRQRWSAPDSRRSLGMASSAASAAAPASSEGGDTGESAAIVNTIKAIFGAGGFALPWAFAQGGTVLVSLCLAVSCVFALESLKMLVKAQDVLVEGMGATSWTCLLREGGLWGWDGGMGSHFHRACGGWVLFTSFVWVGIK